jgi:holo-[acyl-carrier protein] synthase
MVVGFGIDVVEIARMARVLGSAHGRRFVERTFTEGERAFCDARRDRATHYAARFAAKEAASKALGVPDGIGFHDVEVVRAGGAPTLVFRGVAAAALERLEARHSHLTLSHDGGIATAAVILERAGEGA